MGEEREKSGVAGKLLSAAGVTIAVVWIFAHVFPALLPIKKLDCRDLISEMIDISEKNTAPGGVKLIAILSPETISDNEERTECRGRAKWSNAIESGIRYRAYQDADQWFLEYQPEG